MKTLGASRPHLLNSWSQPGRSRTKVFGRGRPRRYFTHSKVMAWVAVDRTVKSIERFGLPGPLERCRNYGLRYMRRFAKRGSISSEYIRPVLRGERSRFESLDDTVGRLSTAERPRVQGTVHAIERNLMRDGLVARYSTKPELDGLPAGEGVFLACSFWLADNFALLGRQDDAVRLFEHLLDLRNDVRLLSEE